MSKLETHDDSARVEPWLVVICCSVVPVFLALYLPSQFLAPLVGATVALFAIALLMLRRQTIARREGNPR
jgi:uncharacterized membrane protein YfcA